MKLTYIAVIIYCWRVH